MSTSQQFWIMKSEPDVFSIKHLENAQNKVTPWEGVRNYQARNFMRDQMKIGDQVLFYHSSCAIPGVAGIAVVHSAPYPDKTQFIKESEYYDKGATIEKPRWFLVDVKWQKTFKEVITLEEIRQSEKLKDLLILRKGNRLSITPCLKNEFKNIVELGS
jgi:predicted RNA-binding protein with PUA-like domain